MSSGRRWKAACVIGFAAAYGLYCVARMPPGPVTAPDSYGYLAYAPIHLLGYVSFLRVVGANGAMVAQPILYATALAWLGVETLRLTSSVTFSAAVVVAATLIPGLRTYHYSILTESLFMSCVLAFLASVFGFVRAPSARRVALVCAVASLTAIIRLPGLGLFIAVFAMLLMSWRCAGVSRTEFVVAALVPVVLILGGERLAAKVIHGDRLTSLLGRHVYAKAALIEAAAPQAPSAKPEQERLEEALETRYAPIRRLLAQAPPEIRAVLSVYYETCLNTVCVPEIGTYDATVASKAVNDALDRAGRRRLARSPWGYAELTARNYRSLWTAFRISDPALVPALKAFIDAHRPLPFEQLVLRVSPHDPIDFQVSASARFLQPTVTVAGWATGCLALLCLLAALARRALPLPLMTAGLASLAAHGILLLYAMFGVGTGRYMLGVWPSVTTAALFGIWWVRCHCSTLDTTGVRVLSTSFQKFVHVFSTCTDADDIGPRASRAE